MSEEYKDLNHRYYDEYYRFKGRSKWMEKIWSEAFGDEYPKGLEHYGYLTKHDLDVISDWLQASQGDALLDIGCGRGGPGLRLAEQLKLELTGIDLVPGAVAQAEEFSQSFLLEYPATFRVGDFDHIPVADSSFDVVLTIDSLWAATDKINALKEIKRVMKPGARLVFTFWDLLAVESVPLFELSGLKFNKREDTPDWKEYQNKVYEGILRYEKELVDEMGDAANMLLYEAKASPPYLDLSVRRIYCFEKPA